MRIASVVVALVLAAVASNVVAQDGPRIAGFHAYLFNSKTGLLSGDMLARGSPPLGNVPSGAFSSASTLVAVRIELDRQAPVPHGLRVRLLATESGVMPFAVQNTKKASRIVLDSSTPLGPVNEEGITYVVTLPRFHIHPAQAAKVSRSKPAGVR